MGNGYMPVGHGDAEFDKWFAGEKVKVLKEVAVALANSVDFDPRSPDRRKAIGFLFDRADEVMKEGEGQ